MKHKDKEYEQARLLRSEGNSIRYIAEHLAVSKSTVSLWVRDIELTQQQINHLNDNARLKGTRGRENFSRSMYLKRAARIAHYHKVAEEEYQTLRHDPDFMFGLALYIGEGSKGEVSTLIIANWNPLVINKSIQFFEKLGIPHERMRCKVVLHPTQDVDAAETFWSEVTKIPLCQFANTSQAISPGSRGKRGQKWPHGGCRLSISSVELRHKMNRWMELALENNPAQP
jgi:hypothetical protein